MKREVDVKALSRSARQAALEWRTLWWPGIRPLAISATICATLLMAFWVIADEVVEDRRDRFDHTVSRTVHEWSSPTLTEALRLLTHLGSTAVVVTLYGLMASWLIARRRRRAAMMTVLAGATGQLAVHAVKTLLHRGRPDLFPPLVHPSGYSFPSGHTFAATVAYGLLAALVAARLRGRMRLIPWLGWAITVAVVAYSRIYLGAHYATDVLGSFLLGGAWLLASLIAMELLENPRRFLPSRADRP